MAGKKIAAHLLSSRLTIVGSGIQAGSDLTGAARSAITRADKVFYLVTEPLTPLWLRRIGARAQSLHVHYAANKPRAQTYQAMTDQILRQLRKGGNVCAIFYGHPGVFADPAHDAINRARAEGFDARMLPGISSLDWLFADLLVDPATDGCTIQEAAQFLARGGRADTNTALVLLQVGLIGERNLPRRPNVTGFRRLVRRLAEEYGPNHSAVLYEASPYFIAKPTIQRFVLRRPEGVRLSLGSTLYVPVRERHRGNDAERRSPKGARSRKRRRT